MLALVPPMKRPLRARNVSTLAVGFGDPSASGSNGRAEPDRADRRVSFLAAS